MSQIKIRQIIAQKGLDTEEVAKQLFPGNKFPRLALNRVMAGGAVLDANQISKFALLSGVEVSELYSGANWKAGLKKGIHVFTNGSFRAELDTKSWITKIFHNDSLFHESIIHSGSTQLSAYFEELEQIVAKYK